MNTQFMHLQDYLVSSMVTQLKRRLHRLFNAYSRDYAPLANTAENIPATIAMVVIKIGRTPSEPD